MTNNVYDTHHLTYKKSEGGVFGWGNFLNLIVTIMQFTSSKCLRLNLYFIKGGA